MPWKTGCDLSDMPVPVPVPAKKCGLRKKPRAMSTKGSTSVNASKGTFGIVQVNDFIRFSDGSKLQQANGNGQLQEQGANPTDVGAYRLYSAGGVLYVCLRDLTAPNPVADSNLSGFRIMATLAQQ